METQRHRNLVLVVNLDVKGVSSRRDPDYDTKFMDGKAEYYHTYRLTLAHNGIPDEIIRNEVRFVAVVSRRTPDRVPGGTSKRVYSINHLFPVLDVELKKRSDLGKSITGIELPEIRKDGMCWLFHLAQAVHLKPPVSDIPEPVGHFRWCFVPYEKLVASKKWEDIQTNQVYPRIWDSTAKV